MTSISVSHLTDVTAYHLGNDDPQRVAVLDGERLAVHRVGEQRLGAAGIVEGQAPLEEARSVDPSTVPRSAPRKTISQPPGIVPARSRISTSGTPVHSAVLTAPSCHCSPGTGGPNKERPLPAHSSVATSVWEGMSQSRASSAEGDARRGRRPPAARWRGRGTGSRSGSERRTARSASRRRLSERRSPSRSSADARGGRRDHVVGAGAGHRSRVVATAHDGQPRGRPRAHPTGEVDGVESPRAKRLGHGRRSATRAAHHDDPPVAGSSP